MKINAFLFIGLTLLAIIMASCDQETAWDCIKSTGKTIRQTRSVGYVRDIVVNDNVNLYISNGRETALDMEGGKNVLAKVTTDKLTPEQLEIRNNNTCNEVRNYSRQINAWFTNANLYNIRQFGFGDIKASDTLKASRFGIQEYGQGNIEVPVICQYISVDLNGLGSVILHGYSRYTRLSNLKYARFNSPDYVTDSAEVYIDGEEDIRLQVRNWVKVHIRGGGNLRIIGRPEVLSGGSGKGKVILE